MVTFTLIFCLVAFAVFCATITYTFGYAPFKDIQKKKDSKKS